MLSSRALLWTSGPESETRVIVVVPAPSAGCQSCQRSRPCCVQKRSEEEETQIQNMSGFWLLLILYKAATTSSAHLLATFLGDEEKVDIDGILSF